LDSKFGFLESPKLDYFSPKLDYLEYFCLNWIIFLGVFKIEKFLKIFFQKNKKGKIKF